jgi:hypothetical protein
MGIEMLEGERVRIAALVTRFAWLVDRGVEDLFTDDGVYAMGEHKLMGRPAIRDFYSARRARGRTSRHVFSNLVIDTIDDRTACGRSVVTLHAADGPPPHSAAPVLVADYEDQLIRDEQTGEWRFAVRVVTPVFGDAVVPVPQDGA